MNSCQGYTVDTWAGLFEAWLRKPSVSVKFDLRYESLIKQIQLILFAYNLIIGYSNKNRENYFSKKVHLDKKKKRPRLM